MSKNRPYSRLEFRRRLRIWLKRNRATVAIFTAGMLGVVAIETLLLMLLPDSPLRWWLVGTFQTASVAAYFHLLHAAFLAFDGEAIWHLRGAWGEDNTRDELRRAKRKKLVWGWVDSLTLQQGDIDHLVVTRNGGLVAIDTKWRYHASDTAEMAHSARKAGLRAEGLTRDLLKGNGRGHRRARVNPLKVTPLVVVWGAAQNSVPAGACVDGIEFIGGRNFSNWLADLDGQSVDRAVATHILRSWRNQRELIGKAQAARRS